MKPEMMGALTWVTPRAKATMITSPSRKFIKEPAHRMMIFFHPFCREKARGAPVSSSSPSMAQNPPMGKARRL